MKPGCDSYGGDCFFDCNFGVVAIVRQMQVPVRIQLYQKLYVCYVDIGNE